MIGDMPPGFDLFPANVSFSDLAEFSRYHSCANTLDIMRATIKNQYMNDPNNPKLAKQLEVIIMAEGMVINERNKYLKEIVK